MQPFFYFISIVCAALLLGSCAPMKLYGGPERTEREVAVIKLGNGSLSVDGANEGFFSNGFQVLPGEHSFAFSFSYDVPLPGASCSIEPRFDRYAYGQCMEKRAKDISEHGHSSRECASWRFIKRVRVCWVQAYRGDCQGSLPVVAAAEYNLAWQRAAADEVIVTLNGGDARERGIDYSCSVGTPTVERREEDAG